MKEIIILGSGGHSRSSIDVINSLSKFKIVDIVSPKPTSLPPSDQLPYLGTDSDLPDLKNKFDYALIGIGQIKDCKKRKNVYENLLKIGFFSSKNYFISCIYKQCCINFRWYNCYA
jgi:hypothetical protein